MVDCKTSIFLLVCGPGEHRAATSTVTVCFCINCGCPGLDFETWDATAFNHNKRNHAVIDLVVLAFPLGVGALEVFDGVFFEVP